VNKENLIRRVLSSIVLLLVLITSIFIYRPMFYIFIYVLSSCMLYEWYNITRNKKKLYIYNFIGQVLVIIPMSSLLITSYIDQEGWLLFTLFSCVSTVDTMAMLGGKTIGGIKLIPQISPNKTISGFLVGVLFACITINLLTLIKQYKLPGMIHTNNVLLTFYAIILSIVAQASDILISFFKRKFKIKDTGTIIPGHGGVLDRFDSIILTAPLILFLLYYY